MDDLTTELDLDAIRVFLHLLGVCGWVGGQLVMGALVPVLRKVSPEAPRLAAARFGRIAWACFALAVVTGVWGLAAVEVADRSGGYHVTLLVKLLLVGASGAAAAIHGTTNSVVVRAATGAAAALTALGALLAGAILVA
jgi:putative copper export protein